MINEIGIISADDIAQVDPNHVTNPFLIRIGILRAPSMPTFLRNSRGWASTSQENHN